ncbi:MAG: hypothetical protein Q9183_002903 [Haloplaca sp. 2 TL-2023]
MSTDTYNESRASEVYAATITLTVIATISIALRLISRRLCEAKLWYDDWTIFAAMRTRRPSDANQTIEILQSKSPSSSSILPALN